MSSKLGIFQSLNSMKTAHTLKEVVDDQVDLCYFFSDVYSFCPDATDILDNTLTHFLIVPAILSGFLYDRKQSVSLPLGLYLLI